VSIVSHRDPNGTALHAGAPGCSPGLRIDGPQPSEAGLRNETLPVHFFTIVLNGRPFIEHHLDVFKRLPFRWHWHIVEGVADLAHDTAWSKAHGGRISGGLHRNGLSNDGTMEYLDSIERQFPDRITISRKPGALWDGKLEMVNAPLARLNEECLLWEVDADELWTEDQIIRARALFLARPDKTAAYYLCHCFVGRNLVTTTLNTHGNYMDSKWLRTWYFRPGDHWTSHEPPRLVRTLAGGAVADVASLNPIRQAETEAHRLVFQHYAYATEAQLRFKEVYYGYARAVQQWHRLQRADRFPLRLADYFDWVKDAAAVDTVESQGIIPLAPEEWLTPRSGVESEAMETLGAALGVCGKSEPGSARFQRAGAGVLPPADGFIGPDASRTRGREACAARFTEEVPIPADPGRILFVRTDSIGDAVLAAPMLPLIRRCYRAAQVAVFCQEHVAELYESCPDVNTIICFNKKKAAEDPAYRDSIVAELRAWSPDFILNGIYSREALVETLLASLSGIPAVGMEGDLANISVRERDQADRRYACLVKNGRLHASELDHHRDFLTELGVAVDELKPIMWTTREDEAIAEAFFAQQGLDPARTIALFPNTQNQIRVYPKYIEALRGLNDYRFLILGGEDSVTLCGKIAAELPGDPVNVAGRTTLREMASLIRRCRLLVGADSAAGHMACAEGIPNVIILAGAELGRFFPYSPLTSVAALPLECFGCGWRCPYPHPHCVVDIPPELVTEAVRQTLAESSLKPRVFIPSRSRRATDAAGPARAAAQLFFKPGTVRFVTVAIPQHNPSTQPAPPVPPSLRLADKPGDVQWLLSLAKCRYHSGTIQDACQLYERALQIEPGNAVAAEALAIIRSQDNSAAKSAPPAALPSARLLNRQPAVASPRTLGVRPALREESARNQEEVAWWRRFIFEQFDPVREVSETKFLDRFKRECEDRWLYICQTISQDIHFCAQGAVLDIGNGPCGILNFIPARIKVGVDPNNELYQESGILYSLPKDIVFLPARAEAIPQLDGTFDFITCINVLDHTNDPGAILDEVKRLLKPGGIFFLSVDMRKEGETSLVHPHAITGETCLGRAQPLVCVARRENKRCYDDHPTNKRFEGWFQKPAQAAAL
jgi:ADP-heptose:LPS heptosyltransferase/2-polyprenyl-3-methyl-5-hydroxy-6-metoxy-1,4-benzoquinol methylase